LNLKASVQFSDNHYSQIPEEKDIILFRIKGLTKRSPESFAGFRVNDRTLKNNKEEMV